MKKFLGIIELPSAKKRRLQEEAIAQQEAKQQEIGSSLVTALTKAAALNTVYNLMNDGTRSETVKEIRIVTMPKNGDSFTIVTVLPCNTCGNIAAGVRGYHLMDISVNLSRPGKELHVYEQKFGDGDRYWSISELPTFMQTVLDETKNFTLFPKTATETKAV
ncbi:MAG: hypothetical protein WCI79_02170 [Candidatus Saccharibacteria bacterium]